MWYSILADVLVAIHVAYVAFVVFGQLAILVGIGRGWRWIRNWWFRLAHLAAIVVVALEAVFGIDCPLTIWEADLRALAGEQVTGESFVGRLLHGAIFVDMPIWALNMIHISFAVVVIATFVVAPPRRR
jgi:Protein of Unknown function (DUF2784)